MTQKLSMTYLLNLDEESVLVLRLDELLSGWLECMLL